MLVRRLNLKSRSGPWLMVSAIVGLGLASTAVESSPVSAADTPGWKQGTVTVTEARGLTTSTIAKVSAIALSEKALSAVVHQGTVDGISVRSGTRLLQSFESGHFVPLSLKAISATDARVYLGADVADGLGDGEVVLSGTSAKLRSAKPGDVITVRGWNDDEVPLRVSHVVEDRRALDSELLVSVETARSLGVDRPQSMIVWRFPKLRTTFVNKLRKAVGGTGQVVDSWSTSTVDVTLSQARTKVIAGEFSFHRTNGDVVVDTDWKQSHLATIAIPKLGNLTCNKQMTAAIQRTFKEISDAGLATEIDFVDTKRSGGCFNVREIRSTTGTTGRNLSRHSWAIAIDVNPTTNAYGAVPTLDLCVVEIFRSNGFAWGGSFLVPDGMHFEYTGPPKQKRPPPCVKDAQR